MKASILSIGDELLIGQVVNTNAAWLGNQFAELGIANVEHLSVADTTTAILSGLRRLAQTTKIICVTGGLGPTKDDLTKVAICDYFDDTLQFSDETFERLTRLFARFGRSPQESHKMQCYLPTKARLFQNDVGTAPGMYFEQDGIHYYFMPGVPFEMKNLFAEKFIPLLRTKKLIDASLYAKTILTAGIGESILEQKIADIVSNFPAGVSIAYLPGKAQVRLRVSGRGVDPAIVDNEVDKIVACIGDVVFGFGTSSLAAEVGKRLIADKMTIGFAESCTAGRLSGKMTAVPGSSAYFMGSIVSYDNRIKTDILGVQEATLIAHGAVSAPCVEEMVKGALRVLDVDVAVAISGIAGPGGGSEEKPVGTVFIGVGTRDRVEVKRFIASKQREVNMAYFTSYALNMIRLFLSNT